MVVSCVGHDGYSSNPINRGESKSETDLVQSKSETDLVRGFVQEFYDWYVQIDDRGRSDSASDLALKRRPSAFDTLLASRLKEDSRAKAKAKGEIVGLEFDPFLNSQDPCDRYEVVTVRSKAQSYLVDVRGVGGCGKHDEADLVAEVVFKNGKWLFTNFHYPGPPAFDLLTALKQLRDDRK
jgi:hypothetical protein